MDFKLSEKIIEPNTSNVKCSLLKPDQIRFCEVYKINFRCTLEATCSRNFLHSFLHDDWWTFNRSIDLLNFIMLLRLVRNINNQVTFNSNQNSFSQKLK